MIKGVVVRYKNGGVIRLPAPKRHKDVHAIGQEMYGWGKDQRNFYSQGFYTDDKDWLDRRQARKYMEKLGHKKFSHKEFLFTEDIW